MPDPITLVRWRRADTDPPDDGRYVWTDLGMLYYSAPAGFWCVHDDEMGYQRAVDQPSVWCDPVPPGDDPLTVEDLKDAYACLAWMVAQEEPDIVGVDGVSAERLRRAIEEAEQ